MRRLLPKMLVLILALSAMPAAIGQGLDAENLLAGLPDDFAPGFNTREGGMLMSEFVPKGETVHDWSRMITIQVFRGTSNAPIRALTDHLQQGWNSACAGATNGSVAEGLVNGYPYADWSFACPLSPMTGKPETMWLRAISGNDAFYVVQYAWRAESTQALRETALAYLGEVSVCDTRKPENPCPEGM